jgi:glucosamine-6-phosphate deaminase
MIDSKRIFMQSADSTANLQLEVHETPDILGERLASFIHAAITEAALSGKNFVLGCPGGRSLLTTYRALGELVGEGQTDLANLVIVMMDEYLTAGETGMAYCPQDAHYSCRRFAECEIVETLNRRLPDRLRLPHKNVLFPNPEDPAAYDQQLAQMGGIDIFLIASGASDGHVAFNSPGSDMTSATRVVRLAEMTRCDNMNTFPAFASLDEVPEYGISIGLGTIISMSRQVVLVIHGSEKSYATQKLLHFAHATSEWPATVIFACRNAKILVDREVVAHLDPVSMECVLKYKLDSQS